MNTIANRIRDWIDAEDYRPILAAILIVQVPILAVMAILFSGVLGYPWWLVPAALGIAALTAGWIILAVTALTRWLGR